MSFIDDIKSVAKTIQQAGNIELYQKILDMQAQALDLVEENATLKRENRELVEKLSKKNRSIREKNALWIVDENDKRDGPFCPICYGKDDKLIPLTDLGGGEALCHVCNYLARS